MEIEGLWLILLAVTLLAGILSGAQVMFVLSGVPLLVALIGSLFGHFDMAFIGAYPQRVFGVMNNTLLIAVPMFILMGLLLESSRLAENMLKSLGALMGGSPSMMALSVLFVSALIAASTGIIGATIVMLTLISLPSLVGAGVSKKTSTGLICAAGTLGQIIPPSIVLVLLGDQISSAYIDAQREIGNFAPDPISVGDLFAGALIPGLVLVTLYGVYVLFVIGTSKGSKGEEIAMQARAQMPAESATVMNLIGQILPPVTLIIVVLGSILMGVATPTEAAVVGVAGTILLSAFYLEPANRRATRVIVIASAASALILVVMSSYGLTRFHLSGGLSLNALLTALLTTVFAGGLLYSISRLFKKGVMVPALSATVRISGMVFGIVLASSMLSLVFRGFGGDDLVHELLTGLPGGQWTMLAVVMLVIFLLGFILEFVEIVFIVIPIVGPVLLQSDIDPVWFAILVALNLQTSFLTPPFGFALFYFRSVAPPEITTRDIYLSIIPFVAIQILTIGIIATFPALATWLPHLLFG